MKHLTATSVLTVFLILLTMTCTPEFARAQGDCGILVATTGADGADCGLNPGDPCATISTGISRAQALGLSCVFVQAGVYPEVLVLTEGVDVIGGYDTSWAVGDHTLPAHRVEVVGGIDAGSGGKYLTVRAHNITQTTRVSNLVLTGPDAVGQVGATGKNAYVVHAVDASVLLENLEIKAGNGANGLSGSDGGDAPTVTSTLSMNGTAGGSAAEYATSCDNSSHGIGGLAGTNPATGSATGGHGGNGGEMDTSCNCVLGVCTCSNCDATSGDYGSDAVINSVTQGKGGAPGSWKTQ